MGKITTKKRILFSFRGQVTINGQIMSEKPGIFCAQNGQKLWVFGQPEGGEGSKIVTTGVTFTAIGVRPLAAGVKTATEGSDLRPLWPSVTAAPMLPRHSPKSKQGIPATSNVPESLVFSGFLDILFIPFVSIKRSTFQ